MLNIFFIVLPVFLVIFLGKGLKHFKLINDDFISISNKLVFKVCLPILLFYKISSADIHSILNLKTICIMYLSVFCVFLLSFIIGKIFKIKNETIGSLMMNSFRSNFAYMGLPVAYYAFGDKGLLSASVLMAFIVPYVNMFSIISLIMFNKKQKISSTLKNIILNPLVIASLLGIFASLLNITFPEFFEKTLKIISGITLPLALFCIGGSLNIRSYGKEVKSIGLAVILKLLILPLTAYIFVILFASIDNVLNKSMVILLASPSATVNYILAYTMGGDAEMTNGAIVISTILSILTFILWLSLVGLN